MWHLPGISCYGILPDGAVAVLSGIGVLQPDCVVMRCYDFALSRHFETKGVHVVDSTGAMMLSHDKIMTHQRLVAAGLPSHRDAAVAVGHRIRRVAENARR